MVPQAEKSHPGDTVKWTVRFSCVLSLSLVQNDSYVTDLILLKLWQAWLKGKKAAEVYAKLILLNAKASRKQGEY